MRILLRSGVRAGRTGTPFAERTAGKRICAKKRYGTVFCIPGIFSISLCYRLAQKGLSRMEKQMEFVSEGVPQRAANWLLFCVSNTIKRDHAKAAFPARQLLERRTCPLNGRRCQWHGQKTYSVTELLLVPGVRRQSYVARQALLLPIGVFSNRNLGLPKDAPLELPLKRRK